MHTIISDGPTPGSRIIQFPSGELIVLAYDLFKDWTGSFQAPLQFHPVVMAEYLEINEGNGLVHPKLASESLVTVNFDWQNIPRNWALATGFGTSSGPDDRCQSYSGPWKAVGDALFTAGDFRIYHFQVHNRPVILATRGQWTFTDDEAADSVRKALEIARDFWHDSNFPYFLITLKPYDTERGSSDGSGFTNAFWMYMSRLDPISARLPQLVHEAFHSWNIRKMGDVPQGEDSKIAWFHEGFTQYYAFLLVFRAGLLSLPAYVQSINRDLRDYPASRNPYIRGRMLALWLDKEIRKESNGTNSLDTVMFDMVHEADRPLTEGRIIDTIDRYLRTGARDALQHLLKGGTLPELNNLAVGPCVSVSVDQTPTFDLGFDFDASKAADKIMGVRDDGPAFNAGLRNGEQLISKSVSHDQPEKLARFTVLTSAGVQTVEFYPRGKNATVQQYHVDSDLNTRSSNACVAR